MKKTPKSLAVLTFSSAFISALLYSKICKTYIGEHYHYQGRSHKFGICFSKVLPLDQVLCNATPIHNATHIGCALSDQLFICIMHTLVCIMGLWYFYL